jgi:hypothetical protein
MAVSTTRLSITATPGKNYRGFTPKTAAGPPSGPHTGGPFTQLQVYGVPGQRFAFTAKTEADVVVPPVAAAVEEEIMGPPDRYTIYAQALREDEEILTFVLNTVTSGILEN